MANHCQQPSDASETADRGSAGAGGGLRAPNRRRRALLQTAAVALGAALGDGILRTGRASATTGYMRFGADNDAGSAATTLTSSNDSGSTLKVTNTSPTGAGVWGVSDKAIGVIGFSSSFYGVYGHSDSSHGLHGRSESGTGVQGYSPLGIGVLGEAAGSQGNGTGVYGKATGQNGVGVLATSSGGHGVFATSSSIYAAGVYGIGPTQGFGVLGQVATGAGVAGSATGHGDGVSGAANDSTGVGVRAKSTNGTALSVDGINQFSQAGRGSFAIGESQHTIGGVKLTANSGVVATLNTSAGAGIYLARARVNVADSRIVLVLNQPAKSAVQYTYFIVDTP